MRADMEKLGNEWDWGTRCEISKELMKNYAIKNMEKAKLKGPEHKELQTTKEF